MNKKKIQTWLKTEELKEVRQKDRNDDSIGHKSGQKIIEILQKKQDKYSDDDKAVISYVHRHSAQKTAGDIEHSRWLYSLKNWRHEPLK